MGGGGRNLKKNDELYHYKYDKGLEMVSVQTLRVTEENNGERYNTHVTSFLLFYCKLFTIIMITKKFH